MKLLKYGVVGVLLAEVVYLFTRDQKLQKEIEKTKWWNKIEKISNEIIELNKGLIDKVSHYDYKAKLEQAQKIVAQKEKALETEVNKIQKYTNTLGDKKVNDIVKDAKNASTNLLTLFQNTIMATTKKKAVAKKAPAKKVAPKKVAKKVAKKVVKKAAPKKAAKKVAPKKVAKKAAPKKAAKKAAPKKKK